MAASTSARASLLAAKHAEAGHVREFEALRSRVYEDYLLACAMYWRRWKGHVAHTAGVCDKMRAVILEAAAAYLAHAARMENVAALHEAASGSRSDAGACPRRVGSD